MVRKPTLVNAGIGAVASVVLSFVPFSPVLGGAVAGYLEGPDRRAALVAGTISGLIASIPIALFGFVAFAFFGVIGLGGGADAAVGIVFLLGFLFVALLIGLLYTVGLGALGGALGAYFAAEYPETRDDVRGTLGMSDDSRTRAEEPARDRRSNW